MKEKKAKEEAVKEVKEEMEAAMEAAVEAAKNEAKKEAEKKIKEEVEKTAKEVEHKIMLKSDLAMNRLLKEFYDSELKMKGLNVVGTFEKWKDNVSFCLKLK
jgi:hypothetical protein